MSLPAPYQEHYYIGDGETVEFPFGSDFTALAAANVKCIIYFQDGTSCVPTFTVNMEAGSITIVTLTKPDGEMLTVPPLGSVVRVFRDTPEQQNVTASQLQNYTAKQLERIFDAIVAMIQEGSYFAKHKTLNLTETQRDVSLEQLGEDQDQGLLYWDAESGTIKSTAYGQDELIEAVERANNVADEAKSIAQETQGNLTSHVQNLSNPHQTSMEKLTDVSLYDLQVNQFLMFDGLHWKNVYSSATSAWGQIIGNIADQTDLTAYISDGLSTKVSKSGDTLTGMYKHEYGSRTRYMSANNPNTYADVIMNGDVFQLYYHYANSVTASLSMRAYNNATMAIYPDADNYSLLGLPARRFAKVYTAQICADTTGHSYLTVPTPTDPDTLALVDTNITPLQQQINHLQTIGRFLSFWDATTGLAQTNPPTSPYIYQTGDYFRVGVVASGGGTNYKPTGSSYTTGVASTVVETEPLTVGQVYYYDGANWALAAGGGSSYTAGTNITISDDTISTSAAQVIIRRYS